ncbi:peptidoglycan-binding protein [Inquilinus limosus]|uniref:peptidoglycan-binding domain-containing protein n=1 Tax=Inquilinus limosus TaxID=171674 RepID=UPI003F174938
MGRLLTIGSQGADVRAVQDVLNFHLRNTVPLQLDGIFGAKTKARVEQFQRANKLKVDGIVGPKTSALLFEVSVVKAQLLLVPRSLTLPVIGARPGLQPPRLIPPLQWPAPPGRLVTPPLILGPRLTLTSGGTAPLPDLNRPNVFDFTLTVPTRQDPEDPFVRSRKAILGLIDDLPVNSRFRAFLGSLVPDPVRKISNPETGFKWGVGIPSFNPFDPNKISDTAEAAFTVRVTGREGSPLPFVTFGAWGDGKAELNYGSRNGRAGFTVQLEGSFGLGFQGTF